MAMMMMMMKMMITISAELSSGRIATLPPSSSYQTRAGLHTQDNIWRATVHQSSLLLGPTRARKDEKGLTLSDSGYSFAKAANP